MRAWNAYKAAPIYIEKKKLGFKAIAVAAAIDTEGNIVACHTVDHSIDRYSFIDFLKRVRDYT